MSKKRAWIVANGIMEDARRLNQLVRPGDTLIAADGGARFLRAAGLTPHLIIGDLDSLSPLEVEEFRHLGVEVRAFKVDKDETDLELAVSAAVEEGFVEIRIAAALGGRLDQTLGNIFLLLKPELAACDVRLDDGVEEVFVVSSPQRILGEAGDTVSLIPIMGAAVGVTTQGLRYPLQDETLYPDRTRGISNRMLGASALVTMKNGKLLCIHRRERKQS